MKNKLTTILLILALFAGLSLLLYPTVSDYWNSLHASQAVADYAENVRNLEAEKYQQVLQDARNYNQMLPYKHTTFALSEEEKGAYDALLDISGTGVMGYIEIPAINISLPVYHGTEEGVLQIAVGHLEWSSLPVGGADTHCVLSGHRGLPSAKLFTNLDKLVVGDKFIMRVLDEVLTYEVDQILIVEPTDVSALMIEAGKDLCTLITCTPYGINSHRLLVRGTRVISGASASEGGSLELPNELKVYDGRLAALIGASALALVALPLAALLARRRGRGGAACDV